jgi:pimeloyl-ACP methyl ester carboxylesterase
MTASRFTLMNPDRVTHLVLEDPLGLADYRVGIPPQSEETLYDHEVQWTDPEVIRGYVEGYFVHLDPKVREPLADVLVRVSLSPDYRRSARAAALTFQMIYQQAVRYEYHLIALPTLLIVGAEDHVVPLGQYAEPAEAKRLGDFVELSAAAASEIPPRSNRSSTSSTAGWGLADPARARPRWDPAARPLRGGEWERSPV